MEELNAKLSENKSRFIQLEKDFASSQQNLEQENMKLQEELGRLRDRYDRQVLNGI